MDRARIYKGDVKSFLVFDIIYRIYNGDVESFLVLDIIYRGVKRYACSSVWFPTIYREILGAFYRAKVSYNPGTSLRVSVEYSPKLVHNVIIIILSRFA